MDQRAHAVEEDLKNILQTRLALADKIATLERHVEATVESTKTAALDALDLARNRAAGFIESTTNQLNPAVQGARRPWMMVGSAVAIGLFAGLIEQRRRASRVYPYYPPAADAADVMPEDGRSHEPPGVYPYYGREEARPLRSRRRSGDAEAGPPQPQGALAELWKPLQTLWDELKEEAGQERERIQNTMLLAGRSFIQDLMRIAGQSLLDQLGRSTGSEISRQGQRRPPYG
jgi:ElaB/YqjD/DUF883 family membrane-anchored ribosome-binding protein